MEEAVLELLSHPDVRTLLNASVRQVSPAPPAPKPSWWARLKAEVRGVRDALAERAKAAITTVATTVRLLAAGVIGLTRAVTRQRSAWTLARAVVSR